MLVLSRKVGEEIVVTSRKTDEQFRIMILANREGKVRIGFDQANDFTIDRLEVHEAKMEGARA